MIVYTSTIEYKQSLLVAGAMRIDLAGDEVEPILDDHINHAKKGSVKVTFVAKKAKKKKIEKIKQTKPKNQNPNKLNKLKNKGNKLYQPEYAKEQPLVVKKPISVKPGQVSIGNTKIQIKGKRHILKSSSA